MGSALVDSSTYPSKDGKINKKVVFYMSKMLETLLKEIESCESMVELYEQQLKIVKNKEYTEYSLEYQRIRLQELTDKLAKLLG